MSTVFIPAPADENQVTLVGTLPKGDNFSSFSSAAQARKALADAILAEKVFLDGARGGLRSAKNPLLSALLTVDSLVSWLLGLGNRP